MKKSPYLTLPIVVCCVMLVAMPAHADLPLSLEDLLTERKKFRLELSSNYSNIDSSDSNAPYGVVQTTLRIKLTFKAECFLQEAHKMKMPDFLHAKLLQMRIGKLHIE